MRHLQGRHVVNGFDQIHAAGGLAKRALDLGMAFVTDHDDLVAGGTHASHFAMHLGDQWAGRVENLQSTIGGVLLHGLGHAMRREHHDAPRGNLVEFGDEARAFETQILDHETIMDNLMANVDGGAMQFKRSLDDIDGAVHARAKPAWLRKQHLCTRRVGRDPCRRRGRH